MMDSTVLELYEYLNQDKIDSVPVYQRNYSWEESNCEQFFNDIKNAGENNDIKLHFIGSIIVIVEGKLNGINRNTIIDGQQRLTTSILFLKAFYDTIACEHYQSDFINTRLFKKRKDSIEIKKLELNRNDDEILKKLLYGQVFSEEDKRSKIYQNYEYFKNCLENENEDIIKEGFEKLHIVGIQLNITENPQLIFESINSTGVTLSPPDLMRNYVLMNKTQDKQKYLYSNYWIKIEENFEKNSETISNFFYHYLSMKLSNSIAQSHLYKVFKDYAFKKETEEFLQDILNFSKIYRKLILPINEDTKSINNALDFFRELKITITHPFLMEVLDAYYKNKNRLVG